MTIHADMAFSRRDLLKGGALVGEDRPQLHETRDDAGHKGDKLFSELGLPRLQRQPLDLPTGGLIAEGLRSESLGLGRGDRALDLLHL